MHIKTVIVDDEEDARDGLEGLIKNVPKSLKLVAKASNATEALELIVEHMPELIFLDINMPEKDGFWLAEKMAKLLLPVHVIFVTAFDEFAIQAIRYAAFDFLTKPVSQKMLNESMERFLKERASNTFVAKMNTLNQFFNQTRLRLTTTDGFRLVLHSSIMCCNAEGNYTRVRFTDGKSELVCMQLGVIELNLNSALFVRTSRSTLINVEYLEVINTKQKTIVLRHADQSIVLKVSYAGIKRLGEYGG